MIASFIHKDDTEIVKRLETIRSTFWIAGGAPLNWYQNLPADSDIDIYFKSEKDFNKLNDALTAAYETDEFEVTEPGYFTLFSAAKKKTKKLFAGDVTVEHIHTTENAITYTVSIDKDHPTWKIQLIKRRYYDTIKDVIDDFDITVCQIALDNCIEPVVGPQFAEDVAAKRLRFNKLSPGSDKRLIKYWTYGYTPSDNTLQLVIDYPELDLKVSENDY